MSNKRPVIALVGATATGKTALSVALAKALRGEVINADSMQFYRGMDIGTAKATAAERQGVAHHLLDIYDLNVEASVATFQHMARQKIADIRSRGHAPILTGGSGLYVRAALDTLEFPPTNAQLRQQLTDQVAEDGTAALVAELRRVDPESADRLHDARRIIRAVEVYRLTGRPFSSYMPQREYQPMIPPVLQVGLRIDRAVLHDRIAQRVHQMIERGWLEEVQHLKAQGLAQAPTASRAIGYKQMLAYLAGEQTLAEATEATIVATRRFARRQETWFKADPRVHWIDAESQHAVEQITALLASD
ncbi:tRNA (adenosine(37)-N6)-dimethylallyltransferase MiaA [Enteractinococcus fodinae]|uniref:tRNA dimethylallyltransferase n=1 Tax=Enteractinococcus fodinae TaxID=684663 RepID=A0ABU2B3N1_9MICC|nr:tRNA (adenosine(37)-N6)-dimethylallyltransferase MiaA [Enteractinococcus fodinae]MDR7347403.1 tRNA dimethylallyltransferase [Enteractinococcus fodinae]